MTDHCEEALFEHCLGLPPEEREAYLREKCPDDPALVESVLRLLESHEAAGEFLEELPTQDSYEVATRLGRIAPTEERPGDRIGPYELLELIGEGAWGTVWIARQTSVFDRQVAIKILKVGMDTKDFLARFEAERQMLAMMDHPNIAKVLDVGSTERGRPYLVMELVKGVQILEFADKNRLGIRERVKLFTKVCRALHHAHRKGVVHRDLKPSNILVSAQYDEALPKVIDFGVAKSNQFRGSGGELYTSMHTFIGTPVYSSPEQLEFTGRDVDARSDIYSLGALLYELLCGATPFDGDTANQKGMAEFVRQAREDDPPRPSQRFEGLPEEERERIATKRGLSPSKLESLLKGDLEWIALKCLEKDPSRRYDSAKDLADDLQAFLDDQTVTASSPSPWRKLRKTVLGKRPAYAVWVEMGAVVAACFVVAFYFGSKQRALSESSQFEISPDSSIQLTDKSIAILPLENLSPDPNDAYFADGIHEDMLTYLRNVDDLQLIGRASTLQYRDSLKPQSEIGRELGVRYLLNGSVRRAGQDIRVSVRLIEAETGTQRWAGNYDRPFSQVFAIQTEIAKKVANELEAVLSPNEIAEIETPLTDNEEAYRYYLIARSLSYEARIEALNKAVELDPDFTGAWAYMAVSSLYGYRVHTNRQEPELLETAKHAIEQVRRIGDLRRYFNLRAMWEYTVNNDLHLAITLTEESRTFDPNPVGHDLPSRYMEAGRFEDALPLIEEAYRKDPYSIGTIGRLLQCYQSLGMWEEGRQVLDRTHAHSREFHEWFPLNRPSLDYLESGDKEAYAKGLESFAAETDFEDEANAIIFRSVAALVSRDFEKGQKMLEEFEWSDVRLLALSSSGWKYCFSLEPLDLARALLWRELGDRGKSLAAAEKAKQYLEPIAKDPKADPSELYNLAICYALLDERESMDRVIEEVRERIESPNWAYRRGVLTEMHIAVAYIVLGENEQAIETLEKASKMEGPIFFDRELDLWFVFDALKGNPRYDALIGNASSSGSNRYLNTELEIVQPPDEKSIAILPFENISGREEDESFANGIHSTLLTQVSQVRDLKPTSRSSVLTYRGTSKRLTQIAGELNVANVLTGDVQVIGRNLRVNIQLTDAATDSMLWGRTYDRELTAENYFSIQSEITRSVSESLNAVLTPQEQDRMNVASTLSTEALRAFLTARGIVESANQTKRNEAIALLEKAIDLDPRFIEARIYLARAHMVRRPVGSGDNWRAEDAAKAELAINKALALDESLAEIHLVKGKVHAYKYQFTYDPTLTEPVRSREDLELAKRSLDRALELDFDNAEIYTVYGNLTALESDESGFREGGVENIALRWFRKAVELDPRNIGARISLASHLTSDQDRQEKERQYREALRIDPNHSVALRNFGVLLLGEARFDEAIPLFRRSIAVDPERFEPHGWLTHCYHFLGDDNEALRWMKAGSGSGRGYGSKLAGSSAYRAFDAMVQGNTNEYIKQLRIAVREKANNYSVRRPLLDADIRAGRFELALMRYQTLFPYLFEKDHAIDRLVFSEEGSYMSEKFQAMAMMEIAEILMCLGDHDRANELLDKGWEFFRAQFTLRSGWLWAYGSGYGVRDAIRFALRGESDAALAAIREAVDQGFRDRLELEASHFDSIRDEPEFKAAMAIVEADLARQLANVRRMEANGDLALIPDDPRYQLDTPAKILFESDRP